MDRREEAMIRDGQPHGFAPRLRENRLLVAIIGATGVVLIAMLGLALDSAVFVVVALGVHLTATFLVATLAIRLAGDVEKPDPTTVARLQAEGVPDPEAALNAAIREHIDAERGEAMTPSAVDTELVGPGSSGSLRE